MFGYIYKITINNPESRFDGCYYIGQHESPKIDDNYYGSGVLIRQYIKKHGIVGLTKEVLTICYSPEELNLEEEKAVDTLFNEDSIFNGGKCLNLKEGGQYARASDIARLKMSLRTSGENNRFYGKHHTEETKAIISEKAKGANNGMYHKTHTPEVKEKLRQLKLGTHHSEETKEKFSKERKTRKWWTNHEIEKHCKNCPDGFESGRLKKKDKVKIRNNICLDFKANSR